MVTLTKTSNASLPLFFNVDAAVGKNCPNIAVDVELVSFLFNKLAQSPSASPQWKSDFGKIRPGSICTPELITAIDLMELYLQTPKKDHKVSVATGTSGMYSGQHAFIICTLNFEAQKFNKNIWPRLDQVAGCPPGLAAVLKRQLVGQ